MIVRLRSMTTAIKYFLGVVVFLGFLLLFYNGSRTFAVCAPWEIDVTGDWKNCVTSVTPISCWANETPIYDWANNLVSCLKQEVVTFAMSKCIKTYWEKYCDCKYNKKWIYLNTEVPFVWHPNNKRCLVMSDAASAPTTVLQMLTRILMTFVMIGGFGMIVWWGTLIASSGWSDERQKKGIWIIRWVVIAFALLWSLWVILRFINPNFFS